MGSCICRVKTSYKQSDRVCSYAEGPLSIRKQDDAGPTRKVRDRRQLSRSYAEGPLLCNPTIRRDPRSFRGLGSVGKPFLTGCYADRPQLAELPERDSYAEGPISYAKGPRTCNFGPNSSLQVHFSPAGPDLILEELPRTHHGDGIHNVSYGYRNLESSFVDRV